MVDFRSAFFIVGVFLIALAAGMFAPATMDLLSGNPDWKVFLAGAVVTMFFGGAAVLANRGKQANLSLRQTFLLTTLIWVFLTLFASLPFVFSGLNLSFTDAYFEAMSGITTTGSTVLSDLDNAPPGILLWRSILQWMGGLGIIVMSISILPLMQVGGMQMFRVEAFDVDGKVLPRMAQLSGSIMVVYLVLTGVTAIALWTAGMSAFEALNHAMTTIATGGYSTSDASVGHFNNAGIEVIITMGMLAGGIPFLLYVKSLNGDLGALHRDSQVRGYLGILFVSTMAVAAWLFYHGGMPVLSSLRNASFSVVSIMTGTGYVSSDYGQWGTFPVGFLFFLTFVGGCAGSTACGMKVFRFQILFRALRCQINKMVTPHAVMQPSYNGAKVSDAVITSITGYFFLFGMCFVVLSMGLTLAGLDFVTALSSAATSLANVGPGLGPIVGPSGTFQDLPDAAKWMLSAGMLVGRLEIFTVVVLFSRNFLRG
ncbi:MAG: TrkH family potassium uptake protein [Rhodospirillales bacterium]|nr:TrkH family potassium uptake protein [Rhodospirillales bacterium]